MEVPLQVAKLGLAPELAAVRRSLVRGLCELAFERVHLIGELRGLEVTALERALAEDLLEDQRDTGDPAIVALAEVAHGVDQNAFVLVGPLPVLPTADGLVAGASVGGDGRRRG